MKTTQEERDEIKRLALENPRRSIYPVIPAFMADDVDALLAERERDKALLKDIHENFIPVEWTPKYYELSARIVAALGAKP